MPSSVRIMRDFNQQQKKKYEIQIAFERAK